MKKGFFNKKSNIFSLLIIFLFLCCSLFAPLISPHDPYEIHLDSSLRGPSRSFPCGQDNLGRDVLSRLIHGSRVSMTVSIATVSVSLIIGILIGSIAGYFSGWADELIMRLIDILLAFPGILLAIALSSVLGPSLKNIVIALSAIGWTGYARITRAQFLSIRERDFVIAAKSSGASAGRIIIKHILPNALSPLLVEASFGMAGAVVAEGALSFLGLGIQPPYPSWGSMLGEGRDYLLIASHLTIFPGIAIMAIVLAFNFIGDGLRDLMDIRETK